MLQAFPALKIGAALGGAAMLAFGAGFFVSKIYHSGYDAGVTAQTLAYQTAAIEATEAARTAEQERQAETARRIAAEQRRASEAERALADRIARERRDNADLDKCLSLPYPDHLRGAVPASLLFEAPAAGDDSGGSREALAPIGPDGLRG